MNKSTWTVSVILDEKTNYNKASKFVAELADEINLKMKKNHIIGIALPKLESVSTLPINTDEKKCGDTKESYANKQTHPTNIS